VLQRLRI